MREHLVSSEPSAGIVSTAGGSVDVDVATGVLAEARQLPSPNCDDRPAGVTVDLIVIHGISLPPGQFGDGWIDDLFTNRLNPIAHPYFAEIASLHVSAHLLIRRSGELVQYVPFHRRAWHAGRSTFQGRENCNDFAIGIELEGDDTTPYADCQYDLLVVIIRALCDAYASVTPDRIAGHCDIAPGRKTDPGPAFDWARLKQLLAVSR